MPGPRQFDVRRELDQAPVRSFHWLLVGLVCLASLFDGYDTVVPAYVIHYVMRPWHLAPSSAGFLISSALIGFAVGSVCHGVIADRVGRRPTLITGLLLAGVCNVLTGLLAHSFGSFVLLRLVTGVGLGVILPLGVAYLNEYVPGAWRNLLMAVGGSGFMVGAVLASLLGVFLTPAYGWVILFYLGAVAVPIGLVFLFVFPESAEYLVTRGRVDQVRALLSRVRPDRAAAYAEGEPTTSGRVERERAVWLEVLSPRYRRTTIALWVTSFFVLFCIYGLQGWVPTLMIQRGEGFAGGFAFGAVLQGFGALGGAAAAYLADRRLGQRLTVIIFALLAAVAALLVAGFNVTVTNVIGVAALGFFVIGAQGILNNLSAMTYPVQIRASGEGFTLGFGRLGSILGPYIGGVLLGVLEGTYVLFVAVAVAAVAAAVSVTTVRTGGSSAASDPKVIVTS
jgi:MFS family permease